MLTWKYNLFIPGCDSYLSFIRTSMIILVGFETFLYCIVQSSLIFYWNKSTRIAIAKAVSSFANHSLLSYISHSSADITSISHYHSCLNHSWFWLADASIIADSDLLMSQSLLILIDWCINHSWFWLADVSITADSDWLMSRPLLALIDVIILKAKILQYFHKY